MRINTPSDLVCFLEALCDGTLSSLVSLPHFFTDMLANLQAVS